MCYTDNTHRTILQELKEIQNPYNNAFPEMGNSAPEIQSPEQYLRTLQYESISGFSLFPAAAIF